MFSSSQCKGTQIGYLYANLPIVRWSLCCGVKPNHLLCTLLYVYICLLVGSGLDMKQEELQDLETLKNIKS